MALQKSLNDMAGTVGLAEDAAANVLAGTSGLALQGALNAFLGTSGVAVQGCLNRMAGTSGFGEDGAAALAAAKNLLTVNQADVETNTTGFAVGSNCTISRSTAQAAHGSASLAMTSVGAGDMYASNLTGTNGVPVSANTQYTAVVSVRAATSTRNVYVTISWYTAAGAYISGSNGSSSADSTSAWQQRSVTATSPGTAAFAAIAPIVSSTGAGGEVHYADKWGIWPGSSTVWTP